MNYNNAQLARKLTNVLRRAARKELPKVEIKGANLLVTQNRRTTPVSLASSTQVDSRMVSWR